MTKQEDKIKNIKPAPKERIFTIGRFIFSFNKGTDLWVQSKGDFFKEYYLAIMTNTKEDITFLTVIFWKLKLNFGILEVK